MLKKYTKSNKRFFLLTVKTKLNRKHDFLNRSWKRLKKIVQMIFYIIINYTCEFINCTNDFLDRSSNLKKTYKRISISYQWIIFKTVQTKKNLCKNFFFSVKSKWHSLIRRRIYKSEKKGVMVKNVICHARI